MEVASLSTFRTHPERFFDWFRPLASQIFNAQPNPAHLALAQLEQMGRLKAIITQNIDSLHRQAGSQVVYELHGHLRQVTCLRCYQAQDSPAVGSIAPIVTHLLEQRRLTPQDIEQLRRILDEDADGVDPAP